VPNLGRTGSFAAPLTSPEDERDVVARYLSHPSDESFRDVFQQVAPRVLGYFRARGCVKELAEDLAQEVMLAVYRQARSLRGKDLFWPWLFRIARNAFLRQIRDRGRRVATVAFDGAAGAVREAAPDLVLRSQFAEWMAWLTPEEREIMTLRYVDELQHHEIAEVLDMPVGTVQWKIFHIKRKLAAKFGPRAV